MSLYNIPGDIQAIDIPAGMTKMTAQCWGAGGGGSSGMGGGGGGHVHEVIDIHLHTQVYYEVGMPGEAGNAGGETRVGIQGVGDVVRVPGGSGGNQGGEGSLGESISGIGTRHKGGDGFSSGGGGGVANYFVDGNDGTANEGGAPCGGAPNEPGRLPGGGGGINREGSGGQVSIQFSEN